MIIYKHYKDYPAKAWSWPSFTPVEMACRGDNNLAINKPAMNKLQDLRNLLGKPLTVNSAYRSPTYNKRIGGAAKSKHMEAIAYDISMNNHDPAQFEAAARLVGFTGFGFYQGSNFIHIDTGRPREWGKRWFKKAEQFNRTIYPPATPAPRPPDIPSGGDKVRVPGLVKPIVKQKTFWNSLIAAGGSAVAAFGGLDWKVQLAVLAIVVGALIYTVIERKKHSDNGRKAGL